MKGYLKRKKSHPHLCISMDREPQFTTELQALRALCNAAAPREEREGLLQSLRQHAFVEPEHQVVFESIRALFPRGPLSAAQLRLHLNNRGFPDTDVEKYFQPAPPEHFKQETSDKITP
jgi:hypothetical protein